MSKPESGYHRDTEGHEVRNVRPMPDPFPGEDREHPWRDEALLRSLYVERGFSMNQIRKGWDCSSTTVSEWLGRHGIEKRTQSEAAQNWRGTLGCASYSVNNWGHVVCRSGQDELMLHRLLAVSEWGIDALEGMDVHHINNIPWDNRPDNIELVTNEEHRRKHLKIDGINRIRVAELYEHGDISSRDLAALFDVTGGTVLEIHKEFHGEAS